MLPAFSPESERGGYLDVEPGPDRPKTSHFSTTLQPWRTFFVARLPESSEEAKSRAKRNLLHFQANYLVVTAVVLATLQLNNPLGLAATVLVAALWALLPQLQLAPPFRLAGLAAVSLLVLYLAAGTLLLNLAFVALLCSVCHAALHPGSVEVGNFELINEDEL
ncbi:unnamed protein product [Effrenium voratum]|nr:unnamed protein product [Effrenium voratum]